MTDLVELLPNQSDNYCFIGMDNYFTIDKVMTMLTEKMIGFIGTAQNQFGWPPAEFKEVKDKHFNSLYNMTGLCGDYLMSCWVDNNVVTMASNVHTGTEVVDVHRKKPRVTKTTYRNSGEMIMSIKSRFQK